ncbi:T9SS type A sorting domain-containing protein [Wenyingzhuangia aestuarii]|uniref:T9SS type A sorting domain-containing protein n=1 Tax=Wenyingzhuangia aestuarii TaxID=1647582 RepID=UPI00143B4220|nr:T9SS type A sorting domain-containing protein [Wenyingzhuangia aestuarii]NJB82474.1 hypothetical protein [Wenyingzhuangia aestuarii]
MKKKLLLLLLLTVSSITITYAQSTITKDPSLTSSFTIDEGDNIKFEVEGPLEILATLTCTSAPDGVDESEFTATLAVSETIFYNKTVAVAGDYIFSYSAGVNNNGFTMTVESTTLSSNTVKKETDVTVSYNSSLEALTINNLDADEIKSITVLNSLGSTVYSSKDSVKSIDLNSIASGVYVLVIELETSRITKKFIKG